MRINLCVLINYQNIPFTLLESFWTCNFLAIPVAVGLNDIYCENHRLNRCNFSPSQTFFLATILKRWFLKQPSSQQKDFLGPLFKKLVTFQVSRIETWAPNRLKNGGKLSRIYVIISLTTSTVFVLLFTNWRRRICHYLFQNNV